jgi:hypothetical protein
MAKEQAVVKGVAQNGRPITETYSLAGFAQVLALIDKAWTSALGLRLL